MPVSDYEAVIGLEIHVQLNTKSKLFCACDNDSATAEPNANICPICTGQPGALPRVNAEAIVKAARLGLGLGCEIAERSVFDRKSYFYPDSPLGYQITQLHFPIAVNGQVEIWPEGATEPRQIRVNRGHIEADAGKLVHKNGHSYADWNRTSTPLVEVVTEPDLRSAAEARAFFETVRAIARTVDASGGDLEKGHLRCDANVSLHPRGSDTLGVRAEVKNLNSFRAVEAAINYEITRQAKILDDGQLVEQETRGWDDAKKITVSQRGKEDSHDYRYFPEPDLPPLTHSRAWIAERQSEIPELPPARRTRLCELGLKPEEARVIALDFDLAQFWDAAVATCNNPKQVTRWLLTEAFGRMKDGMKITDLPFTPAALGELIQLIDAGEISSKIGKDVFDIMFAEGQNPRAIVEKKGWKQVSDDNALAKIIAEILAENPQIVEQIQGGDERPFGFLVGQVMKKTQGQANPGKVNQILREQLGK